MASPTLDSAIVEFLDSRRARGIKKGTVANERTVLKQLMAATGNLLVKNLTSRHIDMYFSANAHLAASTLNRNTAYLEGFFKWCRGRRYMPRDADPLEGIGKRKEIQRDFIFLPAERFEELLNAARHQRDRAVLAIGLYTFQRASELTRITWDDVHDTDPDPRKWEIAIYRKKTDERDWLPLCLELKEELQRWRLEYGRMCGEPPHGDWLVVPAFDRGEWGQNPDTHRLERKSPLKLNPKAPITNCQDIIHRALKGIGFDDTKQEGAHTLRRSGGLALYQELAWNRGHDGALRIVQSMYGHKSVQTTERYLRLTLERKRRNDLLGGQSMFPARTAEVTELEPAAVSYRVVDPQPTGGQVLLPSS